MGKYFERNFMCDKETDRIVKELRELTGKNRSQLIREALRMYYEKVKRGEEV